MYEDSDNDIRYLKLFLNKRMDHLAEECGVNERQGNMSLENESMHKITLHKENGEETLFVLDGTLLNVTDLPSYDNRIYDGWAFDFDGRYEPVLVDFPMDVAQLRILSSSRSVMLQNAGGISSG